MSLSTAMASLMATFDRYAAVEGKKDTLTKLELKNLVENEMPCLIQKAKNSDGLEKLMKDLDRNKDSEVTIEEFLTFVCSLTCVGGL
uniref:S100 calcium binding protein P n=1 Tax=Cynoglossus semilaevis TaxID=244447 RepID=A0A3P8WRI7_CYNSE